MKLVLLSDTHRAHVEYTEILKSVGGDLLIHAGDSDCYDLQTAVTFMGWLAKVSKYFTHGSLVTFGNHDNYAVDPDVLESLKEMHAAENVRIAVNESIEIAGLKFWASPYSQPYGNSYSAFTLPNSELKKIYAQIPMECDVIVSHVPPFGILDNGHGSEALIERIEHVQPRLVIFGHIHERHGSVVKHGITFVNASSIGTIDKGPWLPIYVEIDDKNVSVEPPGELDVT